MTSRFQGAEFIQVVTGQPRAHAAPRPPAAPWLFAAAMGVSVAISLIAGTTLGYMAAMQHAYGADRWTETVQAHGHLQLVGWVAVFVTALMFEFGVRLNQHPALPVRRRAAALAALGVGAVLSAAGQLWHGDIGFLFPAGAVIAAAGGLLAAFLILRIPAPYPLSIDAQPLWFRLAVISLASALVLEAVSAFRADFGVVALHESRLASELLVRGFVLPAILGVAIRAFPGHLGPRPVTQRQVCLLLATVAASLVTWAAGSGAFGLPDVDLLRRAGDILLAAALFAATAWLGIPAVARVALHRAGRIHVMVAIAWLGLVLYAVALAVGALLPGYGTRTLFEEGAVRHLFLLGFMAPLMVAMANIVLARFGAGRLYWPNALAAAFVAIAIAAPLRVLPPLVTNPPGGTGQFVMGMAAGVLQVGLALFAAVCVRNAYAVVQLRRRAAIAAARRMATPGHRA